MFQGGGNIPLLLPIVGRLVTRGHDVSVVRGPGVRALGLAVSDHLDRALRSTGARVSRLPAPVVHPLDASSRGRGLVHGWVPAAFRTTAAEAGVARWIPHWAAEIVRELGREPADTVVTDFVLVGALVAAEAAALPSVALVHNVYRGPVRGRPPWGPGWPPRTGVLRRIGDAGGSLTATATRPGAPLPFLNGPRHDLGLPPLRRYVAQEKRASRVVVLTSPTFDPPMDFPPNV